MILKIIDLLGNEIKAGDFVAYATSCTASGEFRRGVCKGTKPSGGRVGDFKIEVKSLIPDGFGYGKVGGIYKRFQRVTTGSTSQRAVRSEEGTLQFKGIRLGSFEQAFTEQERALIIESRIKIKFGE